MTGLKFKNRTEVLKIIITIIIIVILLLLLLLFVKRQKYISSVTSVFSYKKVKSKN